MNAPQRHLHCTAREQAELDVQDEDHMKTLLEESDEALALPLCDAFQFESQASNAMLRIQAACPDINVKAIENCLQDIRQIREFYISKMEAA